MRHNLVRRERDVVACKMLLFIMLIFRIGQDLQTPQQITRSSDAAPGHKRLEISLVVVDRHNRRVHIWKWKENDCLSSVARTGLLKPPSIPVQIQNIWRCHERKNQRSSRISNLMSENVQRRIYI